MLVYANSVAVRPDKRSEVIRLLKEWLNNKIGYKFNRWELIPGQPFSCRTQNNCRHTVKIVGTPEAAWPFFFVVEYWHTDERVKGRSWTTTVSIKHDEKASVARVVLALRCEDTSVANQEFVITPTIPRFIRMVCDSGIVDWSVTPGGTIQELNDDNAPSVYAEIADLERRHSVVIITPNHFTDSPSDYMEPERIPSWVFGFASVYQFATRFPHLRWNKKYWQNKLNENAVTVFCPSRSNDNLIRGKVFSEDDVISCTVDEGVRSFPEYLFKWLSVYQNLRHYNDLLTADEAHRRLVRYRFAQLSEGVSSAQDYARMAQELNEENDKLRSSLEKTKTDAFEQYYQNEGLQEEIKKLNHVIDSLKYRLDEKASETDPCVERSFKSPVSYVDMIQSISCDLSQRIVLHNNAEKGLSECVFEDIDSMWKCILWLYNRMHAVFLKHDRLTQKVLDELNGCNAQYKPHQSEITKGAFPGYEKIYDGVKFSCDKHLCIGGGSFDPKYCARIYFDFHKKTNQIVILHAGEHLANTRS